MQHRDDAGFGLYIHWPFCLAKCPYCDFNSHVAGKIDHARWQKALLTELDQSADVIGRRPLTSIFFGGGTPSLMAPETAEALITRAIERFGASDDIEITLEANPTSAETARLAAFADSGVNRLSLGVQALEDEALRFLGREHSAREALGAVEAAARLFPRFSFDLIYARPGQTLRGWTDELRRALDHAGGHLSVYQLTIEPGTRFFQLQRTGALDLPEDDLQADLFAATREMLEAAGLPAYEVSNHAAEGEASRHNLVYWRAGDYAGIGPGAHGRLTLAGRRIATRRERMPRAWLDRVEAIGHAGLPEEVLDAGEQAIELVLMGLRLSEGIDLRRLQQLSRRPLDQTLNMTKLTDFARESWLDFDADRLSLTETGFARLNGIVNGLLESERAYPEFIGKRHSDGRLTLN